MNARTIAELNERPLSRLRRTPRQIASPRGEKIRDRIMEFVRAQPHSPSIREICDDVGLSSSSTVYSHLCRLREEGRLEPAQRSKPRQIVPAGRHDDLAEAISLAESLRDKTADPDAAKLLEHLVALAARYGLEV